MIAFLARTLDEGRSEVELRYLVEWVTRYAGVVDQNEKMVPFKIVSRADHLVGLMLNDFACLPSFAAMIGSRRYGALCESAARRVIRRNCDENPVATKRTEGLDPRKSAG